MVKTPEPSVEIPISRVDILEKESHRLSAQEMDRSKDWAQSLTPKLLLDLSCPKSRDHIKDY